MKKLSFVLFTALVTSPAFAEGEVSTAISTMQSWATENLTLVGTAMITLTGIAIGFKWVKAAMFG